MDIASKQTRHTAPARAIGCEVEKASKPPWGAKQAFFNKLNDKRMKTDRVSELRHQLAEYNERAKKHIDALPKDWGFQYSEVREATIIKGIGIIATALLELLEQGGEK